MRVVFLGSGEFAVPILKEVSRSKHEVALVICSPDRPAGRGLKMRSCPVAKFSEEAGLSVHKLEGVNSPESIQALREVQPEVLLLSDFGQILGSEVLSLPPKGAVNVHPSLLPRYRGPAPIPRVILAGERETGVTVIFMEEEVDAGEILLQGSIPIEDEDDNLTLRDKLAKLGAKLAVRALDLIEEGRAPRLPQESWQASYAPWVRKEEAWLDWSEPAVTIWRKVRAFAGWPVARTLFRGRTLLVHRAGLVAEERKEAEPGRIMSIEEEGVGVAAGRGAVKLVEVQVEGKKRMLASEWARGARVRPGNLLGREEGEILQRTD